MVLLYDAAPTKPTFSPDYAGAVAGDDERRNAAAGLWDATRDLGLYRDNANAEDTATTEAYARRNKAIFDATGVQLTNPRSDFSSEDLRAGARLQEAGADPWAVMQRREAKWADDVKRLARERPEHAGVIQPDRPIREDAFAIARGAETGFDQASQRADQAGVGRLTKIGATLAGGTSAMMRDPLQVGTLMIGGGIASPAKSVVWKIVQTMFNEAIVNGGVEAGVQLAAEDFKKQAGVEHGLVPGLKQVGLAALFGGGFGGLLEGGAAAFRALGRDVPTEALQRAARGEPAPGDIGTLADALGVELDPQTARTVELAADQADLDRAAFGEPPEGLAPHEADALAADTIRAVESDTPFERAAPEPSQTALHVAGTPEPATAEAELGSQLVLQETHGAAPEPEAKVQPETAKPDGAEPGPIDLATRPQPSQWEAIPIGRQADGTPILATHATMIEDADRSEFYAGIIASCRD